MPRVRGRQRGELTRSFQFDGVAIGGHERGCGELKRSWPPAGVAIGGVWGVEVSRDGQQKAASGVSFVEDSGDRKNHHNIEFWGRVESTTHAGGHGGASTPQGSDVEY